MNTMLFAALQAILKAIIGAFTYEQVKSLVNRMDSTDCSGEEKRAAVIQGARTLGLAISHALLNLAIEVAVNSLRRKA